MIRKDIYEQALFETVKRGATEISPDVRNAFVEAIRREENLSAKEGLIATLNSMDMSAKRENPLCVDTGWPIFYFKVGNQCVLEGGFVELENAARRAVAKATEKGYLRATMKHPLTGFDPGNNIGMNIPDFTYKFVEGDSIEISYAAKGGGSECFGGTRHRIVAFADGIQGLEKFVIDSFVASARAGAVCPPSVLGIGIGGTANVAANLAKEAACLRTIGSRHPEPQFAKIEEDLYKALNSLGIGILGAGGDTSVLAVNVEYAYTHIAGIAVATSTNCMIARRASCRISANGTVTPMASPMWFGDR